MVRDPSLEVPIIETIVFGVSPECRKVGEAPFRLGCERNFGISPLQKIQGPEAETPGLGV